jgi:hypothetical protein
MMGRETLVTVISIFLAVLCFSLSCFGAYIVVKQTHPLPTETVSVDATEENTVEEDNLPTETEVPSETITEPQRVEVLPETGVVEEDLEADPIPVIEITPETVEEPPVRYSIPGQERAVVESVVMAEAGGESFDGQMAVAQCILAGCEELGMRPDEVVIEFQYTPNRPQPSESVKDAVSAVFDRGEVAVEDTILWFYAPAGVSGTPWHESQRYVCTIGGHKFFGKW